MTGIENNKWRKNFDILLDVSKAMSAEKDHFKLLELIVGKTSEALEAERSSLFLLDREKNELYTRFAEKSEIKEIRVPLGHGIVGYVAQSGEVVHIPDAYQDERFNQDVDKKTGFHTRNILCTPLVNHDNQVTGSLQVLNKKEGGSFTEEDIELLKALASQAAVSLDNANLVKHYLEKEKMAEAMRIAQNIQQSLFPQEAVDFSAVDLYGWSKSAEDIGGDYYDYLKLPDGRIAIIIGDVSGHGVGPALLMTTVRAFLRALVLTEVSPKDTMTRLNRLASNDLQKDGMFVTMFYGIIDLKKKTLTYSSAGHDPPIILRAKSENADKLDSTGVPLGIVPDFEYDEVVVTDIEKDDLVVLVTDGIWESIDASGERFGWERVISAIVKNRSQTLDKVTNEIVNDLFAFVKEVVPEDDLTVVMARIM